MLRRAASPLRKATNNAAVGCGSDSGVLPVELRWLEPFDIYIQPKESGIKIGRNGGVTPEVPPGAFNLDPSVKVEFSVCVRGVGTSKWNKIEHRMFSFITMNWRARPLISYETIVKLIGNTSTRKGLKIKAKLNQKTYPTGVEVPDSQMAGLNLKPKEFHGDWNYSLLPQ